MNSSFQTVKSGAFIVNQQEPLLIPPLIDNELEHTDPSQLDPDDNLLPLPRMDFSGQAPVAHSDGPEMLPLPRMTF